MTGFHSDSTPLPPLDCEHDTYKCVNETASTHTTARSAKRLENVTESLIHRETNFLLSDASPGDKRQVSHTIQGVQDGCASGRDATHATH